MIDEKGIAGIERYVPEVCKFGRSGRYLKTANSDGSFFIWVDAGRG
jgi:hypothetical protein